jgi:hypothetical protein
MTKTDYKRIRAQPQLWYDGRRKVPDIGPSGGYVFYDKGNNSGGWRFLEAAPASSEFAAGWEDAMELNGIGGWRLPSLEELALMYKNLKQKGLGDFTTDGLYCSSVEDGALPFFKDATYGQRFSDGAQIRSGKVTRFNIRAVREF